MVLAIAMLPLYWLISKECHTTLEVPKTAMAVLAMDIIGCLPITSNSNRWALMPICLHTSYVFPVPIKENLLEMYYRLICLAFSTTKVEVWPY